MHSQVREGKVRRGDECMARQGKAKVNKDQDGRGREVRKEDECMARQGKVR